MYTGGKTCTWSDSEGVEQCKKYVIESALHDKNQKMQDE